MSRFSLLLVASLLAVDASAIEVAKPPVTLAFGNGMLTPFNEAGSHLAALYDDLVDNAHQPITGTALILYHQDDVVRNLAELTILKNKEAGGDPKDFREREHWFFNLVTPILKSDALLGNLLNFIPDPLIAANDREKACQRVDFQVESDVKHIGDELREGRTVLLVSHSLGNMYANLTVPLVLNGLTGSLEPLRKHLRVVGVGVPASRLELGLGQKESSSYVTNEADGIIFGLRVLVEARSQIPSAFSDWKTPLPSNISDGKGLFHDIANALASHGFQTGYINTTLPGNRTFLEVTRCALNEDKRCETFVPREFQKGNLSAAPFRPANPRPHLSEQDLEPDPTPGGPPPTRIREVEEAFSSRDSDVMKMAVIYAYDLWNAWQTAVHDGKYTKDVEAANVRVQESQICLRNALKASQVKDNLSDTFSTVVQAILAADLKTFKKYYFADSLADKHAVIVEVRPEIACEHAGAGFLGKRIATKTVP
jgi:hypothetical protein